MNPSRDFPELITISQASKLLNAHPNTLRHWDRDGTLKSVRFGRKMRRYRLKDIENILNNVPAVENFPPSGLISNDKKIRDFISFIPVAIFEIDFRTQKLISVNDAMCRLIGYTRDELLNLNPYKILDGDSIDLLRKRLKLWQKGETPSKNVEYKLIKKDGSKINSVFYLTFHCDADNKPLSIHIIAFDITGRKKAEEESEKSRRLAAYQAIRLQTILDHAQTLIWITEDLKANNIIGNRAAVEFTRVAPGINMSKSGNETDKLVHFDVLKNGKILKPAEMPLQWVCGHGQPLLNYEMDFKFNDNTVKSLIGNTVPLRDENKKQIGAIGAFIEITNIKNLEKQKDEFLGMASHELKTPLTSIKAYTQILKKRLESDKTNYYFTSQIDSHVDKIVHLVNNLLDVGKISAQKLIITKKLFDLNKLIRKIVTDFQYTNTTHMIVTKGAIKNLISADEEKIAQVLNNLITNALKYSPRADKIIINLTENNREVKISVKDFGIGIKKADIPKIFRRYFRVNEEKSGFGLGLYITSQIIFQHNGKIWVESECGKGSIFYFTLPIS